MQQSDWLYIPGLDPQLPTLWLLVNCFDELHLKSTVSPQKRSAANNRRAIAIAADTNMTTTSH